MRGVGRSTEKCGGWGRNERSAEEFGRVDGLRGIREECAEAGAMGGVFVGVDGLERVWEEREKSTEE